jgi:hypothetical protein
MTRETLLQKVSRFAAGVRNGSVEPEILQDARRRTTDIIGIALAASGMEPARIVEGVIEGWGGEEQAGVIGRGERYPAASAALMNGTLAHSLDYDDTHLPSVLHPSPPGMSWSCASAWPVTTLLWATRSSSRKVCTPHPSLGLSVLHSRRRWSTGSGKRRSVTP